MNPASPAPSSPQRSDSQVLSAPLQQARSHRVCRLDDSRYEFSNEFVGITIGDRGQNPRILSLQIREHAETHVGAFDDAGERHHYVRNDDMGLQRPSVANFSGSLQFS